MKNSKFFENVALPFVLLSIAAFASVEQTEAKNDFKANISKETVQKIVDGVHTSKIEEYLSHLSSKPHLAGTARDEELAKYIQQKFLDSGFDSAELVPYNLLLSLPNLKEPNKIFLHKGNETIFENKHMEDPIGEVENDPDFIHAYLAYTPAGTVETFPGTGVVYVNYGRMEDFEGLHTLGVNVSGHVAMARFGKIYRGNKIANAEHFGATGMILFSDPQEVAKEGTDPENVYDNSFWLPDSGMQRGSTNLGKGDPLTPGWPSKENAYRIPVEEANLLKIPAQPIGYADARVILERLGGDAAPEDWQGGLEGLVYRLGPNFDDEHQDVSLTMTTHNTLQVKKNYNVIGIIRGAVEPDRYILVGNHRDAWGYGAADPSSGTAQLLESANLFGNFLKEGKRPSRTLVFCSWGAEEMGLIGSVEWVEEHMKKLQSRAVAYINTDTCSSGPKPILSASPLLSDLIIDMTKFVPGVENNTTTLYEEWKEHQEALEQEIDDEDKTEEIPYTLFLKGGSDHVPFSFQAGVTSMDIRFRIDKTQYGIILHPGYHTGYETFNMVIDFLDPGFKSIQACSRLSSLIMEGLSETPLLPFSLARLPKALLDNLKKSEHREALIGIYDKYGELENAIIKFGEAIQHFNDRIMEKELSVLELRIANDQMRGLERHFLLDEALNKEGTSGMRNAVIGLTKFDSYSGRAFPGLADLMYDYHQLDGEEKIEREKDIKKHLSDLTIIMQSSADYLKEPFLF